MSANCPAWKNSRSWWRSRFKATCCRWRARRRRNFDGIAQESEIAETGDAEQVETPAGKSVGRRQADEIRSCGLSPEGVQITRVLLLNLYSCLLNDLQKIIAAAGITSRRKAEELITGGLVSVNGTVVTELGSKADPRTRPHSRQWKTAARLRAACLPADEQTQRIRHHLKRSGASPYSHGPAASVSERGSIPSDDWTTRAKACCCSPMTANLPIF